MRQLLLSTARDAWPDVDLSDGLLNHVLQDALESDLALGDTPDQWSPLGRVESASFQSLVDLGRGSEDRDSAAELVVSLDAESADGSPVVRFRIDREPVSALTYFGDAFVVAVPAAAKAIVVTPDQRHLETADNTIWPVLDEAVPEGERIDLIVWRVYTGANSWAQDDVTRGRTGAHLLALRNIGVPAFVVGRAVRVRAKKLASSQSDHWFQSRLVQKEENSPVAVTCPRLQKSDQAEFRATRAVVVVHGTMSTALDMAAAVREWAPKQKVFRFEHDTWRPLQDNVDGLTTLIRDQISGRVLLVAHSRGGLVAARAAAKLSADPKRKPRVIGVVTLGTPFLGTPVAVAPDVGVLGMRALMGGLRFLGGPAVDAMTRVLGLALLVRAPRGIAVMSPDNDALPIIVENLPANLEAVAGVAHDTAGDHYGLGVHFARGVFGNQPNDLVVARISAQGGSPGAISVDSDHYTYLKQDGVRNLITTQTEALWHSTPASKQARLRVRRVRLRPGKP